MSKLIVLRGNSGSGKSTVAKALRDSLTEPALLIEQDHIRRVMFKEIGGVGSLHIDFIYDTVRFGLEHNMTVICEGIFTSERYNDLFARLMKLTPKHYFFYFDVPLAVTLERHLSKPNRTEFGEAEMRKWYKEKDFLACVTELVIPETVSIEESVLYIRKVLQR